MQSDILPPDLKRPNTKTPKAPPMRSLRLQGHSLDEARKRLKSAEEKPSEPHNKEPETEAVVALGIDEPRKKGPHHWLKYHLSKRSKIELIIGGAIFLIGIGALAGLIIHYSKRPPKQAVYVPPPVKAEPKPTTVASPLTGIQVDPKLAKRPVTGVMIENSPDARPQSGLQSAGVVYEAIAEGGITRFLALFQESKPNYVGPVRSVRPYYIDFATPYQAGIVHVGGSPEALQTIRNGHYRDLDQFFNPAYFSRISTRYAPHNVYTGFDRLDKLNKSKGYKSSKFTPWKRKDDQPRKVPKVSKIDISISNPLYNSHYDYDKKSNTYYRSMAGAPHVQVTSASDRQGKRIHPKTVIALVMGYSIEADGYHSAYADKGSGQMFVFQDGGITKGLWVKKSQSSMFKFLDSTGKKFIPLDAGQTWVVIVSSPGQVTYAP